MEILKLNGNVELAVNLKRKKNYLKLISQFLILKLPQ